jgi:hypothetical protein
MRTKLIVAFAAAVLIAATAPVMTVTNGQPDGNRHPYVGLAIQFDAVDPNFITLCSGSALSSTVFLTASHCFDPARPVFVTYKNAPPFSLANDFTQGTFHPNPEWCLGCGPGLPRFDTHDVAIITLSTPRDPGAFASLPTAGLVDTLAMRTPVDVVGYGTQAFTRGGGQPQPVITLTRRFAPSELIQSNNRTSAEFIKLTANPAGGKGGTCFGDSGGPDVLGGTDIVLAVNSYVTNGNCTGVTYSNRVDLPDILAFIMSFLG